VSGLGEPVPLVLRVLLLGVCGLVVWAAKHGPLVGRLRLPETRRQIPASVLLGSVASGAWRFGLALGTGVRTYAPSAAPYVLAVAIVLARPSLGTVAAASVGFGLGRGLPMVAALIAAPSGLALGSHPRFVTNVAGAAPIAVLVGGLALVVA
jgi:hypothetical protein